MAVVFPRHRDKREEKSLVLFSLLSFPHPLIHWLLSSPGSLGWVFLTFFTVFFIFLHFLNNIHTSMFASKHNFTPYLYSLSSSSFLLSSNTSTPSPFTSRSSTMSVSSFSLTNSSSDSSFSSPVFYPTSSSFLPPPPLHLPLPRSV